MDKLDIQDIAKLIDDGDRLSNTGNDFSSEITKIYDYVEELAKIWTGTSAERYVNDINSFKEEFEEFAKLINEHGNLINAIGKDYKNLEENL